MEILLGIFIGVLMTLSVVALAYLSIKVKLEWYAWIGLVIGVVAVLFGIGWFWSSFLEGYPQSGSMGLMLFSGGGAILMVLTWRHLVAPVLAQQTNS